MGKDKTKTNSKPKSFITPKEIFGNKSFLDKKKYITKEYQDFGYRLALKLQDLNRVSLYIKLAKDEKRILLEKALRYSVDYPKAKNISRIFMWKLKQLREEVNVDADASAHGSDVDGK